MCRIEIIQNGKNRIIHAVKGEYLSSVLMKNGFAAEHLCGGKGMCRKCTVLVDGEAQLSCQYVISSDITVILQSAEEIVSFHGACETGKLTENVCFALDIGTTTLALALVSLDENRIIRVLTETNPQRVFGADVLSRIEYCRQNGVSLLQKTVIDEINRMTDEFDVTAEKLYVSGNTTMLHLFFGEDCTSLGVSPYTPVFLGSRRVSADELSVKNVSEIISLPNISAFAGADIVAGLNYVGFPQTEKYNILIDLGTNAEIVLFSRKKILCTAAAAGPCFEGANISCGMSASDGAIYSYKNGNPGIIGNVSAKGICATGLIDIIAELVRDEIIDETGYIYCEKYEVSENIYITREDVRQYQLAKSAVYSALITLLKTGNLSFSDIEKVYIAGGFSDKLSIPDAIATGLLPLELQSKYVTLNNTSLLGTVRFACEQNDLSFADVAEFADLAENPVFTELFIENMKFSFYK